MFCGCDFLFKWSKKPFWRTTPSDHVLSVAKDTQQCPHPAVIVQYTGPSSIHFERSGAPSPESLAVPVTFVDPFLESAIDSKNDCPPSYSAAKEEGTSGGDREIAAVAAEVSEPAANIETEHA